MYPALLEEYLIPATLEDAVAALARNAEARVIAGGMSLMQLVKSRQVRPRCLVDLRRVASLRQVQVDANGVSIGAMVRHRDVAAEVEQCIRRELAKGRGVKRVARTVGVGVGTVQRVKAQAA